MPINILSKPDCERLMEGMHATLMTLKPNALTSIKSFPDPFRKDDGYIFERLTWAILSNGSKWNLLHPHLSMIRKILFNYNLVQIANLSNGDIALLYKRQIQPLKIPSRTKLETKLGWIRDNAQVFLNIQGAHSSVWKFVETSLTDTLFNHSYGCYIHPADNNLLESFSRGALKLKGIGLAICCEFFNGIGIDEFKPDTHTIRFLNRIGAVGSPEARRVRQAGITIAKTLEQPRKYVDSHIWVFCAEGEGEICTEKEPKCNLCHLRVLRLCMYHVSSTVPGVTLNQENTKPTDSAGLMGMNKIAWHGPKEPSNGYGQEPSVESATPERVMAIKQHLADYYIKDSEEKRLFLRTTDKDVHDWGCYIAGLVLTRSGKRTFGTVDIKFQLQRLMPEIYDRKYVKQSRILPADVRIDAPWKDGNDYANGFPCLERTERNVYRFVGFKEGMQKRYGDDTLKKRLVES